MCYCSVDWTGLDKHTSFSNNHNELPKVAQLVKYCPIWSPWWTVQCPSPIFFHLSMSVLISEVKIFSYWWTVYKNDSCLCTFTAHKKTTVDMIVGYRAPAYFTAASVTDKKSLITSPPARSSWRRWRKKTSTICRRRFDVVASNVQATNPFNFLLLIIPSIYILSYRV